MTLKLSSPEVDATPRTILVTLRATSSHAIDPQQLPEPRLRFKLEGDQGWMVGLVPEWKPLPLPAGQSTYVPTTSLSVYPFMTGYWREGRWNDLLFGQSVSYEVDVIDEAGLIQVVRGSARCTNPQSPTVAVPQIVKTTRDLEDVVQMANGAPSAQVYELPPGCYVSPRTALLPRAQIALFAQQLAVQDGQPTDPKTWAWIEPRTSDGTAAVFAPRGAPDPDIPGARKGAWQNKMVQGPDGLGYSYWSAPSPLHGRAMVMGASKTRPGLATRICCWSPTSLPTGTTPAQWAYFVQNPANKDFRHGFTQIGGELCLVLPSDAPSQDPNEFFIWVDDETGGLRLAEWGLVDPNLPRLHLSGLAFSPMSTPIRSSGTVSGVVVEQCLSTQNMRFGYHVGISPDRFACDVLYWNNHAENDRNNIAPGDSFDPRRHVPWMAIKMDWSPAPGVTIRRACYQENIHVHALGGLRRVHIEGDVIRGGFDGGPEFYSGAGGPWAESKALSAMHNDWWGLGDDFEDQSREVIGGWFSFNKLTHCAVFVSAAVTNWGPVYYVGNVCLDFGAHVAAPLSDGHARQHGDFIKYGSNGAAKRGTVHVWCNTFFTTDPQCGGALADGGGGPGQPYLDVKNCIVCIGGGVGQGYLLQLSTTPRTWTADGNALYVIDTKTRSPWKITGVNTFASYQKVTGQDAHGMWLDPRPYLDTSSGQLRSDPSNPLVGSGVPLVGVFGTSPNIGADQTTTLEDPVAIAKLEEELAAANLRADQATARADAAEQKATDLETLAMQRGHAIEAYRAGNTALQQAP